MPTVNYRVNLIDPEGLEKYSASDLEVVESFASLTVVSLVSLNSSVPVLI